MKVEIRKSYLAWFNKSGMVHREDGPAVVWPNGAKQWCINGKNLTEDEFNRRKRNSTASRLLYFLCSLCIMMPCWKRILIYSLKKF